MAEAVVSFAVERLGDLLISEAKFLHGVHGEIEEIQQEMKWMQGFLEEADKKQIVDKRVQIWVAEMRELAFKIEDVIETFALDVASKKNKSGFKEKLRRFACIFREGASLHKVGTEIKTIKSNLSGLSKRLPTYGITKGLEEGESSNSLNLKNRRIIYFHDVEKDFVGMQKEIEQIISHLKKEDKRCEVVSICGMGGQGKTTVAKQIFNHAQVRAHFEAFGSVSISQQFDRIKVIKSILEQLLPEGRKEEVSRMGDEVMTKELYKVQQEKNCLVVIDDIWTMDAWKNLSPAFPIGMTESGSKILLTTRNERVAKEGSVYKLPSLTEEEGWQLLSRKAFSSTTRESGGKGVPSKMEIIGKEMVAQCKGLPLAVSTLGGILRDKMLRDWERINKGIKFYLAKGEGFSEYNIVTHVLGLSYDDLPLRLRQCFLCLANYKEDEVIQTEKLYLLWIGEGLISSEHKAEGEMMLDVAELYLDELANRSLVQVEAWEFEGMSLSKFKNCSVHDLIRELCVSKVKEEKVIRVIDSQHTSGNDSESSNKRIRRLCIHSFGHVDESSVDQNMIPQIRSLLLFEEGDVMEEKICSLEKYKLLRVLTVQGLKLKAESLESIGKLVYLKYLSFKDCEVVGELPSSIGNLRNLETLDLRVEPFRSKMRIPNVVCKLKQLNHLYLPYQEHEEKVRLDGLNEMEVIEGFDSKYCETQDIIKLSKIKVFAGRIRVDEENPMIIENTIDFIKSKDLSYSRLRIDGEGREVSCLVLLLECAFIDFLYIRGRITGLAKEYEHNCFSGRLTYLSLWECKIEEIDPMILLEKLPNLRHLDLNTNSYMGREMVCSAMGFPLLQSLDLWSLPNLRNWRVDEGAMPNLSQLRIWNCKKLEMLPDGLRFLTVLKLLEIISMPTAFGDRIRVKDGIEGPDFYKDLIKLRKIKVFAKGRITVDEENPMIIENTIDFIKSKELSYSSLSIYGQRREVSCLVLLLERGFIDWLRIEGRITGLAKEYEHNCFSGRLTSLWMYECKIEEIDPMILLEKLPNLRHLYLYNSYMGREMVCSAMGFLLLQSLFLWYLPNLTNWRVDEGAMSNLSKLEIWKCYKLEMLPDGLRFLKALKRREISGMPSAFGDRIRVKDGKECLIFTKFVPSVTLDYERI